MAELKEDDEKKKMQEEMGYKAASFLRNSFAWWDDPIEEMGYEELKNHLALLIDLRNKVHAAMAAHANKLSEASN
ncbi:hypothetical protein CsatB_015839 [Cannabis sativa]